MSSSRLNEMIKLVVMIGDFLFLLVSSSAAIVSGFITSGNIAALNFPEARRIAILTLFVTVLIIICSIYGCCGVINQIVRKGCLCRGRRVLCFHNLMLITVLTICLLQHEQLANRNRSIQLVIQNVTQYPQYDSFENKLHTYFSKAYFEGNCALGDDEDDANEDDNEDDSNLVSSYDKSSEWLMEWIDESCPTTMRRSKCALSNEKKEACDTSCSEPKWNVDDCCPSEELVSLERMQLTLVITLASFFLSSPNTIMIKCLRTGLKKSCPYDQCRIAVLHKIHEYIQPTLLALLFVSFLASIMIIFTLLLICYNPRDDIEIELLKTGVMTEEDIETIHKLKSDRNFSYEKGNNKNNKKGGTYLFDLDNIYETRSANARIKNRMNNYTKKKKGYDHQEGLTKSSKRRLTSRLLNQNSSSRVHPSIIHHSSP